MTNNYRAESTGAIKSILAAVAIGAVAVGIIIGGWQLGWWIAGSSTNHQRQIDQNNYGTQLAYVQQVDNQIAEIKSIDVQELNVSVSEKASLENQRRAIVNQACQSISLINNAPTNIAAFASTECN